VISTPSVPYYIGKYLANLNDVPLILRVWGVRANKLVEHIVYGKNNYLEIIGFIPSIMHMLKQIYSSRIVITLDNSTLKFIKSLTLTRLKRMKLIYPTYAALYEKHSYFTSEAILPEIAQTEGYILGIVTMSKTGSVFKLEQPLFKILYTIAKKLKDISVIVCCGTREEALGWKAILQLKDL